MYPLTPSQTLTNVIILMNLLVLYKKVIYKRLTNTVTPFEETKNQIKLHSKTVLNVIALFEETKTFLKTYKNSALNTKTLTKESTTVKYLRIFKTLKQLIKWITT